MTHDQYWQLFQAVQHVLKETKHMTQIVDDLKAQDAVLIGKVDALLAFAAAQSTQIGALQARIDDLVANGSIGTADAAALTGVLADMKAEADKVTAVLPPPAP